MPTNDERREVAARLRVLADENIVTASSYLVRDTFRMLGGEPPSPPSNPTLGDLQAYDQAFLYRLADLVEPEPERTCRFDIEDNMNETEGNGDVWFRCSECRATYDYDYDQWLMHMNYCPNCGARVKEEPDAD